MQLVGGGKPRVNDKLSEAWMLGVSLGEACCVPQLECNRLVTIKAPKESCVWKPWSEHLF